MTEAIDDALSHGGTEAQSIVEKTPATTATPLPHATVCLLYHEKIDGLQKSLAKERDKERER